MREHRPSGGCLSESAGGDGPPAGAAPLKQTLDRKVQLARLVLFLDGIWPLLWGPLGVAGLFLLVSLLGLWPLLPGVAHKGLLGLFGLAFLVSLAPLARFRRPTRAEALRRLETVGGLKHRPASSYEDSLASELNSPAMQQIWALHRERMARLFSRLKPGWPSPRVDRRDPYALRAALLLLLAAAFAAYGDESGRRLASAFHLKGADGATAARVDAWITPPAYTGRPPFMLIEGSQPTTAGRAGDGAIEAPANSELTIRVNHPQARSFSLRFLTNDGADSKTAAPAADAGQSGGAAAASVEFRETIASDLVAELHFADGGVAAWPVRIIPDRPPTIAWAQPPVPMQRGSLRLHYRIEDDYGVVAAQALFERARTDGAPDSGAARTGAAGEADVLAVPLTLPRAVLKAGEGQTYRDLTAHPWAGLPVSVVLSARDQAGQIGRTDPLTFLLPERQFSKPLARAIIEQRKILVARPQMKETVARSLDALAQEPADSIPDKTVYLGLRTAYRRLLHNHDADAEASVIDQLWQIALRVEDGALSAAERDLRAAQDNLMRALNDNAPPETLKPLMDELRAALNRFLESAAQNAMNREDLAPDAPGDQVSSKELNDMLNRIEALARTGARDAARRMLSQLRDLLESVDSDPRKTSGQSEQMMNALDGVSELIARQQKLLDETFRMQQQQESGAGEEGDAQEPREDGARQGGAQSGRRPAAGQERGAEQGAGSFQSLGREQRDVGQSLDKLIRELQGLGAPPSTSFKEAQRAMTEAGKALDRQSADQAAEQETLALDRMRKGAQSLAEQMMEGSKAQAGRGGRQGRDPLGRPQRTEGFDPGESVKVPDESDMQRAREILDELRRRLGQRERPVQELDYIERLIRRF